jgi:glutamate racemase
LNNKPIGIFDSGIGGITVVREIINHLPNEDVIYFGDTARFPYGPRNLKEVKGFVFEIIEYLKTQDVKLVVIACNTGTAAGLKEAQKKFDLPVIGVIEPGARGAVLATRNRKIGIIATEGTIKSEAYVEAIRAFDAGVEIYSKACPGLVDFVEQGELEGEKLKKELIKYLNPIKETKADTLILGCTHYPLLIPAINEVTNSSFELINSAKEIAIEVKDILKRRGHLKASPPFNSPLTKGGQSGVKYRFIASDDADRFLKLGRMFLGYQIEKVEQVNFLKNYVMRGK